MSRNIVRASFGIIAASAAFMVSCNGLGDLFTLLGQNVRVIIQNDTDYQAAPDIRTSSSSNFFEDIFTRGDQVTGFGNNGVVPPNQTATAYLNCTDNLETIAVGDVEFRQNNGSVIGTEDANTTLRRDTDFDCGDTVRIRLTGGLFNLGVDVSVEHAQNNDANSRDHGDSGNNDMANLLDELFKH